MLILIFLKIKKYEYTDATTPVYSLVDMNIDINTSMIGYSQKVMCVFFQDPHTKNWWLTVGGKNIGYYPAKLFSNLDSASIVGWGGRTRANVGDTSPEMGSGHFPDGKSSHACYFRSATIEDDSGDIYGPKSNQIVSYSDATNCYDVHFFGHQGGDAGIVLQFGGPGGSCGT